MTIKELIKELKQYPGDMKVTRVVNFDNVDEQGNSESEEIEDMIIQTFIDVQFGDVEEKELMLY